MHQRTLDDQKEKDLEHLARQEEANEKPFKSLVVRDFIPVRKILEATDSFCGASSEREEGEISFARQIAIYLLKSDYEMTFESISCQIKCNPKMAARAYHKVKSMLVQPEFRESLRRIRTQYRGPA